MSAQLTLEFTDESTITIRELPSSESDKSDSRILGYISFYDAQDGTEYGFDIGDYEIDHIIAFLKEMRK